MMVNFYPLEMDNGISLVKVRDKVSHPRPRSIPPWVTTEIIETPAFALGFLRFGGCN